jgi:Na+-driven multidrug efflux pump
MVTQVDAQSSIGSETRAFLRLSIPLASAQVAFWGVGLTSGHLLGFLLGFGGVGPWVGQSIGVGVAGVIFVWFHRLTQTKAIQAASP